jgi:hypothetical protein
MPTVLCYVFLCPLFNVFWRIRLTHVSATYRLRNHSEISSPRQGHANDLRVSLLHLIRHDVAVNIHRGADGLRAASAFAGRRLAYLQRRATSGRYAYADSSALG